jgi:hypothetical protein
MFAQSLVCPMSAFLASPRFRNLVFSLLPVFLLVAPAFSQGGGSTAQADLDQLVQNAENIVRGQVTSVTSEPHPQFPNLQTVVVTLSVSKVLKGSAGSTLTFRQFVWDARDTSVLARYKSAGEVVFFLNPVSRYGLTSPVGLEQGRFRVIRDQKGTRYVVNGRGNMGLFSQVSEKAASRGIALSRPVRQMLAGASGKASLDSFEAAVQALASVPQ